ncbi:hypothetical protein [Deinococcus yunweiensis]|uniref:hypothetical protein n=1 Tax=Deinococcus yunweiensis TaxID=367282 RepID=UPI00398F531D
MDAIGPLVLTDPHQPHVKVTFTSFEDDHLALEGRQVASQLLLELHVADLMAVSTGSLTQERRLLRHPTSFMQKLKVNLDMAAQEVVTYGDLAEVFGPDGWYALRSPWKVVRELKCIRVVTPGGTTVLIPCLEAWRFTFAFTSRLLMSSVYAATSPALAAARNESTLMTGDGQTLRLPLTLTGAEREAAITSGTLDLVVPEGYSHADLTALAWLFTDDQAFTALTRFYTSVMAATTQGRAAAARFSAPPFTLPFRGTLPTTLLGLHHGQTFLCLHMSRCAVKFPLPHTLTHNLAPDAGSGLTIPDDPPPEPRYRGRRPLPPDDQTEIDSLTSPDARLATVHLGVRQDRFGPLRQMAVRSRQEPDSGTPVHTVGGADGPDLLLSGGATEAGGRGGRQVNAVEKLPFIPPPSRPVDYLQQFCDLQGVCEELQQAGLTCEWISLNRPGSADPTTAIPSEAGSASTWVGQGIQARRVLIARLSWEQRVAYLLEWERIVTTEYGKLLLCTSGLGDLSSTTLLEVIGRCAERRGVWPESAPGIAFMQGINHRKPYGSIMSGQILTWLRKLAWTPV